jgi:hypothetical protein
MGEILTNCAALAVREADMRARTTNRSYAICYARDGFRVLEHNYSNTRDKRVYEVCHPPKRKI